MRLPVDATDLCIGGRYQKLFPWLLMAVASFLLVFLALMFISRQENVAFLSQTWTPVGS